jgi:hypothetical protein
VGANSAENGLFLASVTMPASAIAAYLKSIPPINNKNLGPFSSSQTVPISVSAVLPPDVYNALPASRK